MSFTDADYVSQILDDVLQAGAAALLAAGRPVDRVTRFPGVPSWDCEMLAAWPRLRLGGFASGSAASPAQRQIKQVLDINVTLLRCVTTLTATGIPSAAIVDADGDGFATDMWVLQRAFSVGIIDGTLFSSARCTVGNMQAFQPLNPGGGLSGMSTTIEVTL